MPETYPMAEWECAAPEELGLSANRLEALRLWTRERSGDRQYRILVVRAGRLVVEWQEGVDSATRLNLASAAKSIYSCILGVAVAEGRLPTADARVLDYYPQMMDVPEGRGPKEGRYAFPKDREITFRQLISNTSGYMKPGEDPGKVFHYQTFGMNILIHALGIIYGVYDPADPGEVPGFSQLIERYIARPIGADWRYRYMNFDYLPGARAEIFGNYCQVLSTARDMARVGLLWLRWGRWGGEQLLPEGWLRGATRTAPSVLEHAGQQDWCYGYGFWTNDFGRLWPDLPRDAFAAIGAGSQLIWVCPSLDLVVVMSPGIFDQRDDEVIRFTLEMIAEAVR